MTHGGFAKTIGVLLVAMLVVCGLVYLGMKPTFGYPDEANRARHEAGFSIIVPATWQKKISYRDRRGNEDGFILTDEKSEGSPAMITVVKLSKTPEIESLKREGAVETTFQGQSAWRIEQKRTLEQSIRIFVRNEGQWYRFVLGKPHKIREEELQEFLKTFRPETPIDPASQPATGPETQSTR